MTTFKNIDKSSFRYG